jgi:hypothetical protein
MKDEVDDIEERLAKVFDGAESPIENLNSLLCCLVLMMRTPLVKSEFEFIDHSYLYLQVVEGRKGNEMDIKFYPGPAAKFGMAGNLARAAFPNEKLKPIGLGPVKKPKKSEPIRIVN